MNDDVRTTASMANSGLGIGIIPEFFLPLLNSGMETRIIKDSELESNICLLRNPNSYLSAVTELFYDFLCSTISLAN